MRRPEASGLLFPAGGGLLPISQRVAGSLGAAPTAARRLDLGFDAIDEEQDRRAVGVLGPVTEPDWLRRRVAVAPGAVRQKARVVIGPEQSVQMLDALRRSSADHDAMALAGGALQQARQGAFERRCQQMIKADLRHDLPGRPYLSAGVP